jgi:predicted RNA methylase
MNMKVSNEFGQYFVRLPLNKSATIVHGDALEINWQSLLNPLNTYTIQAEHADIFLVQEPEVPYGKVNVQTKSYTVHTATPETVNRKKFDYIIGNPPFIGSRIMNKAQKASLIKVFENSKNAGDLDYVTGWYIKAAKYIQGEKTKVAFVSTNSIAQGLQTSLLWGIMLNRYGIKIHFAHRTFKWHNEAQGNAAVYCVIVGFANYDTPNKSIFEYENIKGEAHEVKAKNINPYLVDAKDILIEKRSNPICNVPEIIYGSFALDDGNYTLSEGEKNVIVAENNYSEKLIRPFIGGRELLHSEKRYCLWLANAETSDIRGNIKIKERVEAVKKWRSNSDRINTKKLAETPTLFAEVRQPATNYLAFPTLSSENRKYIPIAFLSPDIIASNQLYILPNVKLFHFGILTSSMHMAWIKSICGRLKSDYRYSASIVYNNYPFPENPTEKQIKAIEKTAQKVLNVREQFSNRSLADLYDPLTMPKELLKAHNELDKAVDLAYRPSTRGMPLFTSEANRMEFLFGLYEKYTADLFTKIKEKKIKKEKV